MAFRTAPNLGPDLETVVLNNSGWYDAPSLESPQVGIPTQGSDGHDYIWIRNGTASPLAANARINVSDDGLFTVTTNATGLFAAPAVAVPVGASFWAKRFAL